MVDLSPKAQNSKMLITRSRFVGLVVFRLEFRREWTDKKEREVKGHCQVFHLRAGRKTAIGTRTTRLEKPVQRSSCWKVLARLG